VEEETRGVVFKMTGHENEQRRKHARQKLKKGKSQEKKRRGRKQAGGSESSHLQPLHIESAQRKGGGGGPMAAPLESRKQGVVSGNTAVATVKNWEKKGFSVAKNFVMIKIRRDTRKREGPERREQQNCGAYSRTICG